MRTRAALAFVLLFACAPAPKKPAGRVTVVATIGVLADWARQVGGERVQVQALLTGNEDAHTYEAKPQDAQALAQADILFRVGLGYEEWLGPVVANAASPRLVTVTAADAPVDFTDADVKATGNPHIWLDPQYAKAACHDLAAALGQVDPKGDSLYRARASAYAWRLDSLTAGIHAHLRTLPDRRFVAFHDAWPYFCRRFGLVAVATVEPKPGQEPSARELARLVELIRGGRIRLVLAEPQQSDALPRMLAQETGVRVLTLDPLCGGANGLDYVRALATAADLIDAALRQE
jgi:ABC-type Zn uptake system ZnuABC Zn-binding protein ZnuA